MQTHTFTHRGATLHYQTGGAANAPVLVLLHGGLGSADDFAALLPRLQTHYRLIAPDTRGHGRSTFGLPPRARQPRRRKAHHRRRELAAGKPQRHARTLRRHQSRLPS